MDAAKINEAIERQAAIDRLRFEMIKPSSRQHWLELRSRNVTSTTVSALFGLNQRVTELELWHRLAKPTPPDVMDDPPERVLWGLRLEEAIAHGIAEDRGWQIEKVEDYARCEEIGLGSSFDYRIVGGKEYDERGPGMLEVKNVDSLIFRNEWTAPPAPEKDEEDGEAAELELEAPVGIEMQMQVELLASGCAWGAIGALIGGNNVQILMRERDYVVLDSIVRRTADFNQSVLDGREPRPDFLRDADLLRQIHGYAREGAVLDIRSRAAPNAERIRDLAFDYEEGKEQEKAGKEAKTRARSEILTLVGDAQKVIGDGFKLSLSTIAPCEVKAHVRDGRRDFRCYPVKGAKR